MTFAFLGSLGDALQFIKSGIMEIPDVLVVTKADLGRVAQRACRDLPAALRSLGARETPVVAVSSLPPATGIDGCAFSIRSRPAHRRRGLPAGRNTSCRDGPWCSSRSRNTGLSAARPTMTMSKSMNGWRFR